MRRLPDLFRPLLVILGFLLLSTPASAQLFGRNKVQYDTFDFKKFETENFEFYFYPEEERAVKDAARMAERWYRRHSRTFLREFDERKPIIFYANDADFQQTNVIQGRLGQGTGGVTESLKERVVMPLTGIYGQTDHVLGHELVHSFQYDIALRGDVRGFSLRRLPLWLVEGMAEYLSIGRQDPHTAMWLRDAALRDDLPTIEQMTRDRSYFPYRFGQAYMAYVGGKYGDPAVANLYKLSGRVGVDSAFVYALGITADSLSAEWKDAVRETYLPTVEGRTAPDSVGRPVIGQPGEENQLNISPSISPDGRYVAFISRRDIFTINLFVADAETGEIIQELESTNSNPHFDALRFINSAGSWSPDGQQFAFVTFSQGDNEINVLDVASGEISQRTAVQGIGAITNLAWSPDGGRLAFTGLDGGISDLYVLDWDTRAVRQLTNDRYAEVQPTWSPDGETLAFTTDRGTDGTDFETLSFGKMRIGLINVESRQIETFRPFLGGQQHNPQFSPDGRSLYFVSDHDGFKDIYRYVPANGQTYRITNLKTGVSGITALSPTMSVAQRSGRMVFSVYANNSYSIVGLNQDETQGELVTPMGLTQGEQYAMASLLPPPQSSESGLVGSYLNDPLTGLPSDTDYDVSDYSSRLRLDRVAPPSVGASVGGPFGSQVSGGVGFFFSDMLGDRNLTVIAQANGTFKDIGGQVSYLDRGDRLNYGGSVSHIPFLFGFAQRFIDESTGTIGFRQVLQRIYQTRATAIGAYPLTQTRRFELTGGIIRYGYDYEVREFTVFGVRDRNLDELEPDPIYLALTGLAYVGDFANFGFTSPLQGGRYRFEISPQIGSEDYVSLYADYRRYFFRKPWTFAVRALHIGNYGANVQSQTAQQGFSLGREFLGDPYRQGFLRGYSFNSIFDQECGSQGSAESCTILEQLYGTRIGLMSAEVRFPLFGTDALGLINFPYLPTELVLFTDAGVAWTNEDLRDFSFTSNVDPATPGAAAQPLVSSGVAARFNLLGAFVFEMFYAYPFQRPDLGWDLGLVIRPGW
jgi:Tol biopolymer transport system component